MGVPSACGGEDLLGVPVLLPVVSKLPIHGIGERNVPILSSLAVAYDYASGLYVVYSGVDGLVEAQSAAVDQP